ncbi:hypothetical protein TH63_13585 [Rufibacter radiotolerans]|uniref:Uncharacterized protein n=1 Tax=Rufibacter radiotolerans TaxID=1379910 RepID=A0A0H4VM76_9BACT|nr:hypothetical protein [Rufibacter radiotolerans]AKQ46423.1 hypothetical protein TH63_13585 [Rufibacter radiotolerans]
MKKLLPILLLTLICFTLKAKDEPSQRFRTKAVAYLDKEVKNPEYGPWKDHSVLIVSDLENRRITVYNSKKDIYDIISVGDSRRDDDNNLSLELGALDGDGKRCTITLVNRQKAGEIQLYFEYNNMAWVYAITQLID